jgi:SAM-dependent methyltransferase
MGTSMPTESYTPGHTQNAADFMARRTVHTHGQFFLPYLSPGMSVLDCGCGPGSISLSMAPLVAPGRVVGVDAGGSQVERAAGAAAALGMVNAEFRGADCRALPFPADSFDRVFSHALLEHLADPLTALAEWRRVLKPGGIIGVCSPDWGGFVLAPPSAALSAAVETYEALQTRNGGDVRAGRKLGAYLERAGFTGIAMSARYECYPSLPLIGEYLALQLERAGDSGAAAAFRDWSQGRGGLFAQCWISCTARRAE